MFSTTFKVALVLLVGLLAGCASSDTAALKAKPAFRVGNVQVHAVAEIPPEADPSASIQSAALAIASQQNARAGADAPVHDVVVTLDRVRYKNAVMSVLVGSSNSIHGSVATADASGRLSTPVPVHHTDLASGMVNGVVGAVVALVADKRKVAARMAQPFARRAMAGAYRMHAKGHVAHDRTGNPHPTARDGFVYGRISTPTERPDATYTRISDGEGRPVGIH